MDHVRQDGLGEHLKSPAANSQRLSGPRSPGGRNCTPPGRPIGVVRGTIVLEGVGRIVSHRIHAVPRRPLCTSIKSGLPLTDR